MALSHRGLQLLVPGVGGGVSLPGFTLTTTSSPETITITRIDTPTALVIDWGDGNTTNVGTGTTNNIAHVYTTASTYTVSFVGDGALDMTYLNAANCKISDISALESLTSLVTLLLNNNSVSDISALESLTSLVTLYLYNNSISDISALESLTSLVTLRLNSNSISDISALSPLTSLGTLYLNSNSISDISALSPLTSLVTLRLDSNSISDISALAPLTSLVTLYLFNNSIDSYAAGTLQLPALGDVRLQGNGASFPTDDVLIDMGSYAGWTDATPELDISGTNPAPTGTYQDPGGVPTSGKEGAWVLVNTYGWVVTVTGGLP